MSTTLPPPVATGRRLTQAELRDVVERYADEVRAGAHVAEYGTDERWHVRIHQDADVDVWLISWTTEQGTELHDHGGSSGAFTVVEGTLDEYVWTGSDPDAVGQLVDHERSPGRTVTFGSDYVHDVRNHREPAAVSVHAYSPPIRLMHFYDHIDDISQQTLLRWASNWTDDPEAPSPVRGSSWVTFASVDDLLETARSSLQRLSPHEAAQAVRDGARLVDIRPEWQRRADGEIPGAVVIERNHLEWRVHPGSDARLPLADTTRRWIVYCTEGYTSSLAASALVSLGLDATDVVGGIHGWRAAGLPTVAGGTPVEQVVAGLSRPAGHDGAMSLASLVAQARGEQPVAPLLTEPVRRALEVGARTLAAAAEAGQVYGLTTGVGALRTEAVTDPAEQARRLWGSHAARFGPELGDVDARVTMLVRLRQLAAGPSGVSVALAEGLERAVLAGAVPVLHGYGSVGTADLGPLAELGLALVGEGPWRHGSPAPVAAAPTDALPFLSSSAVTVGTGALAHADLAGLLRATERVAAVSFLALQGSAEAYDPRAFDHRAIDDRPDPAAAAAKRMAELVAAAPQPGARVQDPFALRTVPQVHGVADEALAATGSALLAEIEAPAENPLPIAGAVLHHGRFLTQRLAAGLDALRSAYVGVATLSQARLAALVDPRLTGLPAFLAQGAAGSSGLMILEYVAADVAARVRVAAVPTSTIRSTVSIGLEETASHAAQGVVTARVVAGLLPDLLACELVAGVRALRLAPERAMGDLARDALAGLGDVPLTDHSPGEELTAAAGLVRAWAGIA